MKIVTIIGARPQFIKAAPVSRAIAEHNKLVIGQLITEVIVHTGQHYDRNMSDVFFEEMHIPKPNYLLDIHGLSHGAMTGQMLEKIEEVLMNEKPDMVLVYGDTNTTLASALAAAKLHIPVAHVEAGLRSFNRRMPEETNRVLTDHVSTILFCPTKQATENLKAEGIVDSNTEHELSAMSCKLPQKVALVGDVMLDAALYHKQYAKKPRFDLPEEFILATIHRAENTDNAERLKSIFRAFEKICQEIPIILPLHPRTRKEIDAHDFLFTNNDSQFTHNTSRFMLIDPVSYLEMIYLLERCSLVMTDSGGLQKEAFFFQKPCVTLRDETEWVE
ncbi:MAG: UDP-N-acetylglucosamine 2-epimerase (non-hydrolyzing), partial [Proteobacteria bacterium]|nr:UDP-N-acetylglucosamine 2-epimerase (non-hydrolyzing) [Pseudomonadota bacterium]